MDLMPCSECGGPLSPRNRIGVCKRNPACAKARRTLNDAIYYQRHRNDVLARVAASDRKRHKHRPSPGPCNVCGATLRFNNTSGLDKRTPECREAYAAILRERNTAYRLAGGREYREKARDAATEWTKANPLRAAVNSARTRARKLNVPFEENAIPSIWPPPEKCPGCNVVMTTNVGAGKGPGGSSTSRSVDRIKPALGYVVGNVQWLCSGCNSSKGGDTPEESGTCALCGGPVNANSKYGICGRNADCKRERQRRSDQDRVWAGPLRGKVRKSTAK